MEEVLNYETEALDYDDEVDDVKTDKESFYAEQEFALDYDLEISPGPHFTEKDKNKI